jgi:hypothetical protein
MTTSLSDRNSAGMNQPLYIVMHIAKTAGTTLRANFELNFAENVLVPAYTSSDIPHFERMKDFACRNIAAETRCIFGHLAYFDMHQDLGLDTDPRYITFLRDPVERSISLYRFAKRVPENIGHKEITEGDWSLEEWFEKSRVYHNRCNGQVRHLLRSPSHPFPPELELTSEHLEEAKRRLSRFWFVGLTERFDDDSHYLYGRIGFSKYHPETMMNAAPGREVVAEETKRTIAEANALDRQLYEFARQLHNRFISERATRFHYHRNKSLLLARLYRSPHNLSRRVIDLLART